MQLSLKDVNKKKVTGTFPVGLFPADFSPIALFPAGFFSARSFPSIGLFPAGFFPARSFPRLYFLSIFYKEIK